MKKFNELQRRYERILEDIHQVELQQSIDAGKRLAECYRDDLDEIAEEMEKMLHDEWFF